MNRRNFLLSIPFLPAAIKAAATHKPSLGGWMKKRPAFDQTKYQGELTLMHVSDMQAIICRKIAETNPYAQLFNSKS